MAATNPITGQRQHPTRVERDKDGNVTYPNDPQVQSARVNDTAKPETKHAGYARGGTNSPVGDDDGAPKWFAPADPDEGGLGAQEDTPQAMFQRDREHNPVPYEGRLRGPFADGTPVNQIDREAAPGEVADEPQPKSRSSKAK